MKYCVRILLIFFLFLLAASCVHAEETIPFDPFGKVVVLQTGQNPSRLVIVFSGAEGWKGEVVEIAHKLANPETLVLGLDYNSYIEGTKDEHFLCPCGDFAKIAQYMEKQRAFKQYVPPILIGNAEGGQIVYAMMAESPNTFLGAISLKFCPTSELTHRMCKGYGFEHGRGKNLDNFVPATNLKDPWMAIGAGGAAGCTAKQVRAFAEQVANGQYREPSTDVIGDVLASTAKMQQRTITVLNTTLGLPLIELPSKGTQDTLVVILSGDGGWISLDRDIANYLSGQGFSIVGFDLLRYLWRGQTPDQGAKDLEKLVSYYLNTWKKKQALLIGYSMGADALPFMVARLSDEAKQKIKGAVLLGPALRSDFGLNITADDDTGPSNGDALMPEVRKMSVPVLCIGGSIEKESLCRRIANSDEKINGLDVELLHANHTFKDDYQNLCSIISDKFTLHLPPAQTRE